jgi:SAM-dependent methyltransferase
MQKAFRDSLARIEREHWWYRARQRILERAIDRLVGPKERSLAIGVGAYREAEMLSQRSRLIAIDREQIDQRCTQVAFAVQADAADLPFPDRSFDAVFILDVLEHIEGDEVALKEVRRVLRFGGSLLITVPAFMFLFGRQDRVSDHKRRYRRPALVKLVNGLGFEVQYSTYFNTVLFPPIAATRLARRWLRLADGDGKTDFDMRLPRPLELSLQKLFAAERHAIDRIALPFGVSLLCSARRVR